MTNIFKIFLTIGLTASFLAGNMQTSFADLTTPKETTISAEQKEQIAEANSGSTYERGPRITYTTLPRGGQWTGEVENGGISGVTGSSKPLEAIRLSLEYVDGGISYRVYLNEGGWQEWASNGEIAGPMDGRVIEAVQIKLTGEVSNFLEVYYRAGIRDKGILDWAKSEEYAGSMGFGFYLESLEAKLIAKSDTAPGATDNRLVSTYKDGFQTIDDELRYMEPDGTTFTGWIDYEGSRYYIKDTYPAKGWEYIDGLKFYFANNGKLVQDLNPIIGVQSSYQIRINKEANCLTIYTKDGNKGFIIPVKSMLCSTGDDTPIGTFYTPEKYRWRLMVNDTYAQYATRIIAGAGYLIHSITYEKPDINTLLVDGYNRLGINKSLGCVRLTTGNAKWIYDNCKIGTEVVVYEDPIPGPFYKPNVDPIPEDQTWDPTDPNAAAMGRL